MGQAALKSHMSSEKHVSLMKSMEGQIMAVSSNVGGGDNPFQSKPSLPPMNSLQSSNWYFYSQEIKDYLLACGYVGLAVKVDIDNSLRVGREESCGGSSFLSCRDGLIVNLTLSVTAKVIETIERLLVIF
ncbi:hypothetical protein LOTGIDRAFT_239596 [Lottia gigantea]|uniref:Uncharacterized protein n=1 Tax=Lottia gigantea TaxID=225164 RepID=V4BSJ0_LOTGI|nr:hypothetical protein LOTGIDRAFT_239596 [Lottia gigantea]ESO91914.1 hypothetical protein LOTGIDRAFT_239596 [Lottia gigantea]